MLTGFCGNRGFLISIMCKTYTITSQLKSFQLCCITLFFGA
uniref:Uncharacterized protein n=1 Tax=Rhizophora mucronata TaxID=61149 RepID=A0A2P2P157_RHIMU